MPHPLLSSKLTPTCRINPSCNVIVHTCALTVENAISILKPADVILDCTDNAPSRYLLSDTAVKLGKPLVSGAAQKFEGQLCIYNFGQNGPCYRCLFPRPPSPEVTGSCAEVGILGVVTGIIGNMQALETIKILLGLHGTPHHSRGANFVHSDVLFTEGKSTLLLFSALSLQPFRTIKLRSRSSTCPACGTDAAQKDLIADTDYVTFCGGQRPDWIHLGMQGSNDDIRRIGASVSVLTCCSDRGFTACVGTSTSHTIWETNSHTRCTSTDRVRNLPHTWVQK